MVDDTFNVQDMAKLDEEIKKGRQMYNSANMFGSQEHRIEVNQDKRSDGDSSQRLPPISRHSANFN